jgi:formiminotetrahydrofolate cyclodeaminase
MQVAERAVALYERLGQLASISAASMKSDLEVARLMAAASTKGALANVEINLDSITDAEYVASVRERVTTLRQRVGDASRTSSA